MYLVGRIQAFNLEENLVKEYGFFDENKPHLTNRFPGGEQPASFTINFDSNEIDEWQEIYYKERKFNDLEEKDKNELAIKVQKELREAYWKLNEIDNETECSSEEVADDHSAYMLIGAFEDPMIGAEEFLMQRLSWKEFCLDLEYSIEYLQSIYPDDKINEEKFPSEVFELFFECRSIVLETFQKVDSGNKQEAKELANEIVRNQPD